jgi:enoyl-CoA hydratase/carnithine racemase
MHMILTGEMISAKEAEAVGLVAKVLPPEELFSAALKTGTPCGQFPGG